VKLLGKELDGVGEDAMLQLAIQQSMEGVGLSSAAGKLYRSVFGSKKEEKAIDPNK
jgi:hypothetical protein